MPLVTVLPENRKLHCAAGENLLQLLRREGLAPESPCGGRGTCGKCCLTVNGQTVLACRTAVTEDCTVTLPPPTQAHRVLTEGYLPPFTQDEFVGGYGVAVDIGTTTVAATLIRLRDGQEVASAADNNAQGSFGADVLTRITYEMEHPETGAAALQKAIGEQLNGMVAQMCRAAGIEPAEVVSVAVSANCTMMHMLLGADARPIGRAPYRPVFTAAQTVPAAQIGLRLAPEAAVYCLPQVSGYIGADVVAGVYVCGLEQRGGNVLFIDIGTNGEIVLKTRRGLLCCSCAAGPALEGMNISCGMRAAAGAVEDIALTPSGIRLQTIDGGAPVGLCGSGILAAVRELLQKGLVTSRGQLLSPEQLPPEDWRRAYLGAEGRTRWVTLGQTPPLRITQGDIRQVQLAKGAILSGFVALLRQAGLEMASLQEVLIAGQFGAHLPAASLTGVGILPAEAAQRLRYVGNSSLTGAYMALLSRGAREEMEALARRMQYLELAETPDYSYLFAESMFFPEK